MPILKMVKCDVCGKMGDFYTATGEYSSIGKTDAWFMVNVSHVYCTQECFDKKHKNTKT